jgi:hypothetical protein
MVPFVVTLKAAKRAARPQEATMKYLLLFHTDEAEIDDAGEMRAVMDAWSRFDAEAAEAGVLIACEPLQHSSSASVFRVEGGDVKMVTDGPFAETKEQVGGFCLLDVAHRHEALEWARRVPLGEGSIEIRAVLDLSELGYESAATSAQAAS